MRKNRIITRIATFVFSVCFPMTTLTAQPKMTLHDCLQAGLENNYDLRIVRNEEQISNNNVSLGNAGFLPEISLSSGYDLRGNHSDQYPAEGEEVIRNRGAVTQTLDAGVDLNWTLFDGFRIQTNYQRLKELKTLGELSTRLAVESFVANLAAEYYNYVQQQIRLSNLKYAVSLSKERLRIVEARYQVGSMSHLDLQQAKVDFNADSSLLIQQYEVLNSSRIRLNEMMGGDVEQQFLAKDTTIQFNTALQRTELLDLATQHNASLLIAKKQQKLSELDLKTLKSRNYPYLQLNAGYGFTHYDYTTGNIDRQRNWGPAAGLTLGYTLFDGLNRRREQKNASITLENRQLEVEKEKLMLESDFANMWMAYQNNMELTNLEIESLENAKLNYEIAMERYKIGDLSGLELREAQNSLLEAEQRLLTARYNTKLCEISILQISGRIGEYLR